jgi:mevalonate kinase
MPAFSATAPGKIILFGEHAVVYGRPAIAVPITEVRAKAIVSVDPRSAPGVVKIKAPDIGLETTLADLPDSHPLAAVLWKAASKMKLIHIPACMIQVTSNIPIAGGMGSSAAVSVAILRAFSASLGHPLSDEQVSELAYEVELIHHGTPSGIDNTVITYAKPVYFVKGKAVEILQVKRPFTLVISDSGIKSQTVDVVSDVREAWKHAREQFEQMFDTIEAISISARKSIESGSADSIGALMDENHAILCKMGVSSPELDRLVEIARATGALGAKLSGAGKGGNVIALVKPEEATKVAKVLVEAGSVTTIVSEVR